MYFDAHLTVLFNTVDKTSTTMNDSKFCREMYDADMLMHGTKTYWKTCQWLDCKLPGVEIKYPINHFKCNYF